MGRQALKVATACEARGDAMSAVKFYRCAHCGNVVAVLIDGGVAPVCCGELMELMRAGTTDGAHEKHVPAVSRSGDELRVRVGAVEHPMLSEHYIQFVAVACQKRLQVAHLKPGEAPEAVFHVPAGAAVTVYELCNIHGLWSAEA